MKGVFGGVYFGGGSGFVSKRSNNDAWDEGGSNKGFSAKKSRFGGGSSGGIGDAAGYGRCGGFGSKNDHDVPRDGALFGGKRVGGGDQEGSWYKFEEDFEMARDDCPQGAGDGGIRGCSKCGNTGHISQNCQGGGSISRACFKCGEESHMSQDCPENYWDYPQGNSGSTACFNCGEEGHKSCDCPQAKGSRTCLKCGAEGHISWDCPQLVGDSTAYLKCDEEANMDWNCPQDIDGSRARLECDEEGNKSQNCPQGSVGNSASLKCGEDGNLSRDCLQGSGGSRARFKRDEEGHKCRDLAQDVIGSIALKRDEESNMPQESLKGSADSTACLKCGEPNHMFWDCLQGSGGNKTCFNCGEEGHKSRDCPQGSGSRVCLKCGAEGHISWDCPQEIDRSRAGFERGEEDQKSRFRHQGSSGSTASYKCGEKGHMYWDCPQVIDDSRACFKCGKEGHKSCDCHQGTNSRVCLKCGDEGHIFRDCPQDVPVIVGTTCLKCGRKGHKSRDCPQNEGCSTASLQSGEKGQNCHQGSKSRACFKCGKEDHKPRDCQQRNSSRRCFMCFMCGEEGHMIRECPLNEGRSKVSLKCCEKGHKSRNHHKGSKSLASFRCAEEGHLIREQDHKSQDCQQGTNSRVCLKCGEEGHISWDCPQGVDGSTTCLKCGEKGHKSQDCPQNEGHTTACFKCGEEGHMIPDCPQNEGRTTACFKLGEEYQKPQDCPKNEGPSIACLKSNEAGNKSQDCTKNDSRSTACFKCGEAGHKSQDCPKNEGRSTACLKSNEAGHKSQDCSKNEGRSTACFKCGGESHRYQDCPKNDSHSTACFKCDEAGHKSQDCPKNEGRSTACFQCDEKGHKSQDCPRIGISGVSEKGSFKGREDGHMSRDIPCAENMEGDGDKLQEISQYEPPPPPEGEEEIFQSMQKAIDFDKYDKIPVECLGDDAPRCGFASFDAAGLNDILVENVRRAKYDEPTPVQKFAIPTILKGRDLMACAPTGSGKTAAFLLPVLTMMLKNGIEGSRFSEIQEPQAIVVGPTCKLVTQINNEARKFSYNTMLKPVVVYGGTSVDHQLRQIEKGAHMVIGTPGHLLDYINQGKISLKKVKFFILDEADLMLDMGFEPEVQKMVDLLLPKEERQILMFSSTFSDEIQKLSSDFLNKYISITVGRVRDSNADIEQTVHQVTQFKKRIKLINILKEFGSERTLVFVELKQNADFLASYLSQSEFHTTSIHCDRLQRECEKALHDFNTSKAPILVATSLAARGLDIQGVKHVVNYDLPKDIDEYVKRKGRTGRCGNIGRVTSFFDPEANIDIALPLVKILTDAKQTVPSWLEEAAESSCYGLMDSQMLAANVADVLTQEEISWMAMWLQCQWRE